MSNYGRYGQGPNSSYGRGVFVREVPLGIPVVWKDFAGGIDLSDVRQDIEASTTPFAVDTIVTDRDRVRRGPGIETVEELAPHEPRQMAVHADLNNTAELVLFAPPYLGVKREGGVVWTDHGLAAGRPYDWTNFGGSLIFGNRLGVTYARDPRSTSISAIPGAPSGAAYASFAGRVFVGNAILDGNTEPMGVAWSDSGSFYDSWDEERGAGAELLIDDLSAGDEILRMLTMGLDFMAIVCRRSLWVARRTGLAGRPADFQPRVAKVGAVGAGAVTLTPQGVSLLTVEGVRLFDGNTAPIISERINSEILPLDAERFEEYKLVFNHRFGHLMLLTPFATYTYDLERRRWFKRSVVLLDGAAFAEQYAATTWGQMVGSWSVQTARWGELTPEQADALDMYYLGEVEGETRLGRESDEQTCAFGVPNTSLWQLPLVAKDNPQLLFLTEQVDVEYVGNGILGLRQPNHLGDYVGVGVWNLPDTGGKPRTVALFLRHLSKGLGAQLDFGQGCLEIARVVATVREQGPIVNAGIVRLPGYTDYDNRSVP